MSPSCCAMGSTHRTHRRGPADVYVLAGFPINSTDMHFDLLVHAQSKRCALYSSLCCCSSRGQPPMDRAMLRHLILSSVLVASRGSALPEVATAPPGTQSASAVVKEAILGSGEASKLVPLSVFLGGKKLSAEPRNSGGIRFSDGMYILAMPIDLSGHASTRETFEAYFISEVSL